MSTNTSGVYVDDGKDQDKRASGKYNKVIKIRLMLTKLVLQQWITFTQYSIFVDMMILMSKQTPFLGTRFW